MNITPAHLNAATIVNLQRDPAMACANLSIVNVRHRLAIKPRLQMIPLQADAHSIPLALFKHVFFLVWNLIEPAASV